MSLGGVAIVNGVHPNGYASTSRSGGYMPATCYVKRNPPSREAGEGLTPWSHLSEVINIYLKNGFIG